MADSPEATARPRRLFRRAPLTLLLTLLAVSSRDAHPLRLVALTHWVLDAPPAATRSARVTYAASSPVAFYRASLALFAYDASDPAMALSRSRYASEITRPFGIGDPHVENFGTLLARDGTLSLEPNDLDAAGPISFLLDLRRLTVGLCLAAHASNSDAARARREAFRDARDIARDAALAYAHALTSPVNAPSAVIDALTTRARASLASRSELAEFTALRDGARHLRRGALDASEPDRTLTDLPRCARGSVSALLRDYRATLTRPPDEAFFTPLDVALHLGRGGASAGRARAMVLLRGPSDRADDDVLLEAKDLDGASLATVLNARARLWRRPDADPYWGAAMWFGRPVQLRTETDAARTLRIARLRGPLGTPAALRALARALGAQLAAIHLRSLPTPPHAVVADPEGFADEQAEVSIGYTEQVLEDWRRLRRITHARPSAPSPPEESVGCDPFAARAGGVLRSPVDGL